MTTELWTSLNSAGFAVILILLLLCWCCSRNISTQITSLNRRLDTTNVSFNRRLDTTNVLAVKVDNRITKSERDIIPWVNFIIDHLGLQHSNPSSGSRRVHFAEEESLSPPPSYDLTTPLLPLTQSAPLAEPEKDLEEDLVESEKEKDSSIVHSTVPTQPKDSVSSDIIETLEDELKTQKATTEILLNRLSKLESRLNKKQNK